MDKNNKNIIIVAEVQACSQHKYRNTPLELSHLSKVSIMSEIIFPSSQDDFRTLEKIRNGNYGMKVH